jgi:autotransporter-associated beta strand protein
MPVFEILGLTGTVSGAGRSISKSGLGSLILTGNNTFTGGLNIIQGNVVASNSHAFGTGPVSIGFGSAIAKLVIDTVGVNIANPITFPGASDLGITVDHAPGSSALSGPIALFTTVRIFVAGSNTLNVSGPISDVPGGSARFQKNGPGTMTLGGANTFHGSASVVGGTLLLNGTLGTNASIFLSGGLTQLGADQDLKGVSVFKDQAVLDLNNHTIRVFTTFANDTMNNLRVSMGTPADQTGIFDSTGNGQTAVGYAKTDANHVLLRKTLAGDADLDLKVDFADLVLIAQNYNSPANKFWSDADFTYDGAVNFQDLVKLAQNYNGRLSPTGPIPGASAEFEIDLARAFATVPEPGGLAVTWLAASGLALKRRRRPDGRRINQF